MIPFVVKGSKLVSSQYALSPVQHIAHGFAIVAVCDLVVDQQIVLCIDSGLYIVCYFSDVIADDHLAAVRIRCRYLRLATELVFYLTISFSSFPVLFNLIFDMLLFFNTGLQCYHQTVQNSTTPLRDSNIK